MKETDVLIIGASCSGLASAAALKKKGIQYLLLEKEAGIAAPWRNHYQRLHLHTPANLSALPDKGFDNGVPRYPSRQQVVDYLESYREAFGIEPVFNTRVKSVKREGGYWMAETGSGSFTSKYLIIATGAYGKPRMVAFKGMESFQGKIMHSLAYKSGSDFRGQKALVVGFGNSACEIALDLYEQGAQPFMAVRSPVNIVPRDLFGISILRISLLLSKLPPRMADAIGAPLIKATTGDLHSLGLKKMSYGPFRRFKKDGVPPVLDIGTLAEIRSGHIGVLPGIDQIGGKTVFFTDGSAQDFDVIIAAIGYDRGMPDMLQIGQSRLEDLDKPLRKQRYFGADGLYFCGFWIAPTGQIREIGRDAVMIAKHIAESHRQ